MLRMIERSALYTAILANEMGLGKTISIYSTIVAGARYAERNKRSSILNGMDVKQKEGVKRVNRANGGAKNVDAYREDADDEGKFGRVVVDEAHCIKGTRTKAHKAVVETNANAVILLTSTPISNRLLQFSGLLSVIVRPDIDLDHHDDLAGDDDPYDYVQSMSDITDAFKGMTVEQKLSSDNFSKFFKVLNPERFAYLARQAESSGAYDNAGV
ncbi:hypothetical protein E4T41_09972, partial [Aureobasidium subglaciale]